MSPSRTVLVKTRKMFSTSVCVCGESESALSRYWTSSENSKGSNHSCAPDHQRKAVLNWEFPASVTVWIDTRTPHGNTVWSPQPLNRKAFPKRSGLVIKCMIWGINLYRAIQKSCMHELGRRFRFGCGPPMMHAPFNPC